MVEILRTLSFATRAATEHRDKLRAAISTRARLIFEISLILSKPRRPAEPTFTQHALSHTLTCHELEGTWESSGMGMNHGEG